MHQRAAGGTHPDPQAMELADEMLAMEGVMRDILDETIPNGDDTEVRESGRTLCGRGASIKGPLARFPTAVELASCPRGAGGGTWHTHVTKDQLRHPTNSLPDTANVVFGEIDVSIVTGTQEAEAVVAASDRQRAADTFRDAIGVEAESTDDVVDAILDGQIPNPPDARRRVHDRLDAMFVMQPTNFTDMDQRLELSGVPAHSTVSFEMVDARHHAMVAQQLRHSGHRRSHPSVTRARARRTNRKIADTLSGLNLGKYAVQSAVAESVGMALRSALR